MIPPDIARAVRKMIDAGWSVRVLDNESWVRVDGIAPDGQTIGFSGTGPDDLLRFLCEKVGHPID